MGALAWWRLSDLAIFAALALALLAAGADVERTTVGDVEHLTWGDAGAVPSARDEPRLLPPFDELLLGYGDRSASLRAADLAPLFSMMNGRRETPDQADKPSTSGASKSSVLTTTPFASGSLTI